MPLECRVSHEIHILCDTSDTRVTIRDREIEVAVDGCLIERAMFVAAGHRVETLSVEARDYARMRRLLSAYRLDRYHNVSDVSYLKRLIGMRFLRQSAHLASTA